MMKHRRLFNIAVIVGSALLTGCQQLPVAPEIGEGDFVRITTSDISNYFGKRIDLNGNYIVIAEDGTFDGTWKDQSIKGTWEMKDDYWCRVLTVFHDSAALNKEDCQLWEAGDNRIRGTRNRGNGKSFIYNLK